ncbi:hypothetical protein PAPYR_2041 [Paratrimastix pyriformis]|uniref:Cystatin domain-containing protein n=1 Tax=Paratrimastix pyriformis TaxID=342808 RepID=A0ABQ8UQN7_9EUKA|nr:hypothetical protein PAPYR_2041 [Paratrimastix pyriformis]
MMEHGPHHAHGCCCGGKAPARPVDDNVRQICARVRPQVEALAGQNFAQFEPVSYQVQVVAGLKYFVQVDTGAGTREVKIWQKVDGTYEPSL